MEKTEPSKYQMHRVTMPEDIALKYLDELLKLVNKQFLDPGFPIALSMATDALRRTTPVDKKPLTCDGCECEEGQRPSRCRGCMRYGDRVDNYRRPPEEE